MLNCPFCDAELGGASNRLRGGRCPKCGSILSWEEGQSPDAAPPADEDSLPMSQIVRTLVQRGAPDPRIDATIDSVVPPLKAAPQPRTPTAAFGSTYVPPTASNPPANPPPPDPGIEALWRGAATVASVPTTTLKAASNAPDEAIDDLLIRPFRINQPTDPPGTGAEYELKEVIGEGGVGTVYAARQASIDRIVAIKMLRDEFAHKRDHRNKFLSEAVVTGELDHPNIVPIYDLGTSDVGSLFYAMKRVRGTPWSDVVREQSLAENLRILMSVADAIAFAHSRGVIHRDLKPENIMLGDFGEVLVMDWGIALSTNMFVKSDRISQSTSMGGTPAYMAPEMATGPLESIGLPSDIYLLGSILYEIITGKPPHWGTDVMTCLYAAAKNEIQPTEKSGELLDIALRAMATKVSDRYASVQDFQAAIREYQSHSESIVLSSRADEELSQARRTKDYQDFARALFAFQEARCLWLGNDRAKSGEIETKLAYAATALEKEDFDLGASLLDDRHPEQFALKKRLVAAQHERQARQARIRGLRRTAQAMAALIFLLLTGGLFFISRQYRQIGNINTNLKQTITDLNVAQVKLEEEKQNVESANSELTKTQSRLVNSNVALVAAKQTAISEAQTARQEEQNAAAASYRAQIGVAAERIDNNSFRDAGRLLDDYRNPQWSFFRHWEWGHLKWLCDRQAGELSIGPRIESLARSADGKLLAAGTASGQVLIFEVDWPGHSLKKIGELSFGGPIDALALSPDGSFAAAAGQFDRGAIAICRREGDGYHKEQQSIAGHPAGVLSLAFSPRGDALLSSARDGAVRRWDVASRAATNAFFGHSGAVWSVAFSPDASQIVTAGDDATVRIWKIADNPESRIYRGHDGAIYAVAFASQGNWIASGGRDRDIHVWKADKDLRVPYDQIAQELERQRQGLAVPAARSAFHTPDYRLQGHTAEVRDLTFSADGAVVLSGGNDNTVRRWEFSREAKSPEYVTVLRGHGGWVRGCALGPDARYAASGSLDGSIKLWDATEYEEVRDLRGHDDAVYWAAFSRDGQRIVTAGRDRRALLWSRDSREPLLVFDEGDRGQEPAEGGLAARLKEGHDFLVTSAAFVPDERRIVTSAGDGTVRVWDRQTGGQIHRLIKTGTISTLALSRDGRWLVTGSETTDAQLWRMDDLSAPAARLAGHGGDISAATFAPSSGTDRPRIVTGDVLGNVRLWSYDPQTEQATSQHALSGHAQGYGITAVAFTPDGRRIFSACQDHTVLVHDAASGERLPTILRHPDSVRNMDLSADGSLVITLCSPAKDQYLVALWDTATGAQRRMCEVSLRGETITSVAFRPDGASAVLASSGNKKSRLWKWDLASPSLAPLWPSRELRGAVWSAVFSADGSRVLAVGGSQARLLNAESGELLRTFSPHGPVLAANFSPQGKLVATCSSDGDVKLWSVDPESADYGRVRMRMVRPHSTAAGPTAINFVAFSPSESAEEATLVTAGDDGTARLWRIGPDAAAPLATLAGHQGRIRSALFSPDGQLVITAGEDKTARLWSTATGQPAGVAGGILVHQEMVLFAAFSPDGSLAITGCDDNNAYLWNLAGPAAGKVKFVLQGHTAAVTSAAISSDGRRAVTGSQDGIAKLWDLESGKEILSLKRHAAELTSVHFSPDGSSILTSSLDQTALVWPAITIDPSLKFSSSRLEIGRQAGTYAIDPQARLYDPGSGDLGEGLLQVWLTSESNGASAALDVRGPEWRRDGEELVSAADGRLIARFQAAGGPGSVAFRFAPGVTTQDAELLLRSIVISIDGPLDSPLAIQAKLTSAHGQAISEAKATLQSADAGGPASLAAAEGR